MEIKNFAVNFSSSRAKILIAVFACVATIAVIVTLEKVNSGALAVAKGLPETNSPQDYTICVEKYADCSNYASGAYTCGAGDSLENVYDGLIYKCNNHRWEYNYSLDTGHSECRCNSNPCNYTFYNRDGTVNTKIGKGSATCKSSDSVGTEGECNGSNEGAACGDDNNKYCSGGVCVLGCKSVSGKIVRAGETTCEKPSYLSFDGVYKCVNTRGSISGLRKGDGTKLDPVSESNPSYHLELQETCYSGCTAGVCTNAASCENLASSIMDALKTYVDE